tara:strand:- start:872 stop:1546 length:675 start_codon:yes stop_codon:yes gene_type:complete
MGRAKEIILKVIPSNRANDFVKKHHYSGKVVPNSQLHFGCFLDGKLGGVMSYGASMDKRKVGATVKNTHWNSFIELNRMAFSDILPKYAESRCIAISIKLIKKNAPHIKWIVSYADATQCGDGTIYRASGFKLIGIKKNNQILLWKNKTIAKKTLDNKNYPKINGKYYSRYLLEKGEAKPLKGYQLKYIYFIDKTKEKDLSVPIIPFSKIKEMGIGMYKGKMRV